MASYIFRRLLLLIPTFLGIITLNFFIIQSAPGGPVEQYLLKLEGQGSSFMERLGGEGGDAGIDQTQSLGEEDSSDIMYKGTRGLSPQLIKSIEKMYGFDKPIGERFFLMLGNYLTFNFGDSFFKGRSVMQLIGDALPVSISLGLWSTLIIYFISIPLGIKRAVKHGSKFDAVTATLVVVGDAIPGFLFAILLIVLFAGGSYLNIFPRRGLVSSNFAELSLLAKIGDYFWHMALPLTALVIGGFATLTMLTKNSFLDEIHKQYATTALDAAIQLQVVELLLSIKHKVALIIISHDLAMMHRIADDICVMQEGKIVEYGEAEQVFTDPQHAYSEMLLERPKDDLPVPLQAATTLLNVENLDVYYPLGRQWFWQKKAYFHAVDKASFILNQGECLGIVGESGSGKTSLGLAIARLLSSKGVSVL